MAKSRLAKSIYDDVGQRNFQTILTNKDEKAGQLVVEIKPHRTSTKCSNCGDKFNKTLAQKQYQYPNCNLSIGRDLNAAINIKNRAKLLIKDLLPPIKF